MLLLLLRFQLLQVAQVAQLKFLYLPATQNRGRFFRPRPCATPHLPSTAQRTCPSHLCLRGQSRTSRGPMAHGSFASASRGIAGSCGTPFHSVSGSAWSELDSGRHARRFVVLEASQSPNGIENRWVGFGGRPW